MYLFYDETKARSSIGSIDDRRSFNRSIPFYCCLMRWIALLLSLICMAEAYIPLLPLSHPISSAGARSFLFQRHYPAKAHVDGMKDELRAAQRNPILSALDELSDIAQGNATALLLELVRRGDQHHHQSSCHSHSHGQTSALLPLDSQPTPRKQHPSEKVKGCMANVYIDTAISDSDSDGRHQLLLNGSSDSRVSQGLLAILVQVRQTSYILLT
jgi:hypothetical protein